MDNKDNSRYYHVRALGVFNNFSQSHWLIKVQFQLLNCPFAKQASRNCQRTHHQPGFPQNEIHYAMTCGNSRDIFFSSCVLEKGFSGNCLSAPCPRARWPPKFDSPAKLFSKHVLIFEWCLQNIQVHHNPDAYKLQTSTAELLSNTGNYSKYPGTGCLIHISRPGFGIGKKLPSLSQVSGFLQYPRN